MKKQYVVCVWNKMYERWEEIPGTQNSPYNIAKLHMRSCIKNMGDVSEYKIFWYGESK